MKPYYERNGIQLFHGDCRAVMAHLEPGSVQCCVTSPPYWGLRDYGIPPSVWGGEPECDHEWGDSIAVSATNHVDKRRWNHARNGRGEDQPVDKLPGWKRQTIEQGKFCQKCNAWAGNLGLEPTPDLFVSHMVEVFDSVRRILADDGTLWLNLGDCYATGAGKVGDSPGGGDQGERWKGNRGSHTSSNSGKAAYRLERVGPMTQPNRMPIEGLKSKDLVGIPWRVAFALQAACWYLRSDIIWHKPNPMPESVTDRPTKSHEYIFLLTKSERYCYDAEAIKEDATSDHPSGNGFKREARLSYKDANGARGNDESWDDVGGKRNRRSVWTVPTKPVKQAHFATFPPKLIEPCILAGCPEGGTVFDPFTGSGTTAMVCKQLGRKFVGSELNAEYLEIAKRRIGTQEVLF